MRLPGGDGRWRALARFSMDLPGHTIPASPRQLCELVRPASAWHLAGRGCDGVDLEGAPFYGARPQSLMCKTIEASAPEVP